MNLKVYMGELENILSTVIQMGIMGYQQILFIFGVGTNTLSLPFSKHSSI